MDASRDAPANGRAAVFRQNRLKVAGGGLRRAWAVAAALSLLLSGCAGYAAREPAARNSIPEPQWDLEAQSEFVRQNMRLIEAQYTDAYRSCRFIVDTANGARPIQELIDPQIAADAAGLNPKGATRRVDPRRLYRYVTRHYEYVIDDSLWPTVADTVRTGRGDCKGLSLLLMSLMAAAGCETYGAISNGHMWIHAFDGSQWLRFETDRNPLRNRIYAIPGFYEKPLYKIYLDHSEKRMRRALTSSVVDAGAAGRPSKMHRYSFEPR
jgi:transglutaminase-like putative cysteine protease